MTPRSLSTTTPMTQAKTVALALHRARRPAPQITSLIERALPLVRGNREAVAVVEKVIIVISLNCPDTWANAIDRILRILNPTLQLELVIRDVADFASDLPDDYRLIAQDIVTPPHVMMEPLTDPDNPARPGRRVSPAVTRDLHAIHEDLIRAVAGSAARYAINDNRQGLVSETTRHVSRQTSAITTVATAARATMHQRIPTPQPARIVDIAAQNRNLLDRIRAAPLPDLPASHTDILRRARTIAANAIDQRYQQAIATNTPDDATIIAAAIACWQEISQNLPQR